jgi:arsenate reductase
MDFVITVCDRAAGEVCPVWPGQPITGHWGFRDPAAFEDTPAATRIVFAEVFREIQARVSSLVSLPMSSLDRMALQRRVREIGGTPAHSA